MCSRQVVKVFLEKRTMRPIQNPAAGLRPSTMKIGAIFAVFVLLPLSAMNACAVPQDGRSSQAKESETTEVAVQANQQWTDTNIEVKGGDIVTISAMGTIQTNLAGATATPEGSTPDCRVAGPVHLPFVAPELPCWSMLGRIGPMGRVFEVGSNRRFKANTSGELYLGVNDNYFGDNTGSWRASIAGGRMVPAKRDDEYKEASPKEPVAFNISIPLTPEQAWKDTDTDLRAGEVATISARGQIQLSAGNADPGGVLNAAMDDVAMPDEQPCESYDYKFGKQTSLAPSSTLPCGSLIGRIGEKGAVFEIGRAATFHSTASGRLFIGINYFEFTHASGMWMVNVIVEDLAREAGTSQTWAPGQPLGVLTLEAKPAEVLPGESYTLSGLVTDVNGKPIAGATVDLWFSFGGPMSPRSMSPWPAKLTTGSDGTFSTTYHAPGMVGWESIQAGVVGAYPQIGTDAQVQVSPPKAGCKKEPASNELSLMMTRFDSGTAMVEVYAKDSRQPAKTPFTWAWGDGSTTQGWSPQTHHYDHDGKYHVLEVISHEDDGTSDCAETFVPEMMKFPQ